MVPSALRSSTLSFSRDGRVLVATRKEGLTVIGVRSDEVRAWQVGEVGAFAVFVDQVWAVRGEALARFRLDGTPIATVGRVGGGAGELVAAAAGPPAVLWTGATPGAWTEEGARISVPEDRLVIPLTGRRWVTASGGRVGLPSGLTCDLGAASRVLGGAITFDATAVVVLAERAGLRELVTIALANGRAQQKVAVPASGVWVASRAGTSVVQVGPRELVLLDLRRGRVLGQYAVPYDVTGVAIAPDGEMLALRDGDERLELIAVAEAIATRSAKAVVADAEPVGEDAPVAPPPRAAPLPIAAPPPRPTVPPLDVRELAPRAEVELVDRETALAHLDHEIRLVALRTLRAIAIGWDTRRLGYGNEGLHPFEHEVAALVGMNAGFARDYIEAAEAHLVDAQRDAPASRGPATPIGALAAELGLSSLAVEILLTVAAPALWSEAARLYGILANDPARPLVDEALLAQVLAGCASRHDLAAELDARAPLVRLGVIEIDTRRARPFAGLAVHPCVLARLRREVPELGPGLVERGSDRAVEELALAPGVLTSAASALAAASGPLRLVLRGRPGAGRRTLLAALASMAYRALAVFDVTALPRTETELVVAVRAGLRRAQLAGLVPCLVGVEAIAFADRSGRDVLREVVHAHPGPVAVVLPNGEVPPFDAEHVAIELPVLAETERLAVWEGALADAGLVVGDIAGLSARYRLGPGMIHRAIAAVRGSITRDADAAPALERFIRQARDARLGAYARRVERLTSWEHVVLPADIADSLRELVSRVRHRRTVFEDWGMDRTMATSRGLTALFSGPPGTGKTLVAGAIARELGLELYQVDLSKVMSKWIGETERNLAAVFDAAEDGQVVLLFDEADSLFAKRTEVRSSNDRYANLEVNYLLQRLDAFEGIAILTTNARTAIDPAFKRRLSFRLSFPFPDEETRVQLWRAHLPSALPIAGELALDRLARKYQLSGGYIRNACLRAAFLAAQEASAVTQDHLERAVALEFAELGKLSTGGALD